jgi:hypothetical protein
MLADRAQRRSVSLERLSAGRKSARLPPAHSFGSSAESVGCEWPVGREALACSELENGWGLRRGCGEVRIEEDGLPATQVRVKQGTTERVYRPDPGSFTVGKPRRFGL